MEIGLTENQRIVISMYYLEGKKIPQIAKELGKGKSAVSRTMKRAIENLKKINKAV
ncbi:RNA polymerase sigma factor [Anaerosolibacter sp.]|uniref:RNA polymerase sigma factor n=1 Tax=Anaerosolibacter sp. TaxID=1872527 RepID=UPI0039EF9C2E